MFNICKRFSFSKKDYLVQYVMLKIFAYLNKVEFFWKTFSFFFFLNCKSYRLYFFLDWLCRVHWLERYKFKVAGMGWKCWDVCMFPYKLLHKSVRNAWSMFVNNALCFKCYTFVSEHMHFTEFRLSLLD